MRMVAGCIRMARRASEAFHDPPPPSLLNLLLKITTAGIYVKYSETRTVARMKIFRSGVSIPLEVSKANQVGLILEPLEHVNTDYESSVLGVFIHET